MILNVTYCYLLSNFYWVENMIQCLGLENIIITVFLTLFPKERCSIFREIYPICRMDSGYKVNSEEAETKILIAGGGRVVELA